MQTKDIDFEEAAKKFGDHVYEDKQLRKLVHKFEEDFKRTGVECPILIGRIYDHLERRFQKSLKE